MYFRCNTCDLVGVISLYPSEKNLSPFVKARKATRQIFNHLNINLFGSFDCHSNQFVVCLCYYCVLLYTEIGSCRKHYEANAKNDNCCGKCWGLLDK